MPAVNSKKQVILSWDAFPEPPPEADDWKPNPDMIAKPGVLKDPRFNKDPQVEQKRVVMKREMRLCGYKGHCNDDYRSSSPSVSSTAQAPQAPHPELSRWPAPIMRSMCPAALISKPIPAPEVAPAAVASPEAVAPSARVRGRTMQAQAAPFVPTSTRVTPTVKGTMENFPVMPMPAPTPKNYNRVSESTTEDSQPRSGSPATHGIPAWAAPLEKLLAGGSVLECSISVKSPTISTPPHKRKVMNPANGTNGAAVSSSMADGAIATTKSAPGVDLEAQLIAASEASRRVSVTTASVTTASQHEILKEVALPENSNMELLAQYQRGLDIALINFMEGELDLGTHGTKAQLTTMDHERFKMYFDRVQLSYNQLWMSKRLSQGTTANSALLTADLATSQAGV